MYSPPTIGVPPMSLFRAVTSLTGPAIRLVPVSAIASQPLEQNELLPIRTLWINNCEVLTRTFHLWLNSNNFIEVWLYVKYGVYHYKYIGIFLSKVQS
jgi:hypothetical protein